LTVWQRDFGIFFEILFGTQLREKENKAMPKVSAEDRAYKEINKLILSQKYPRGDRLVEAELALSRTPVRNAPRKLIAEGLLENQDNKGCLIPRITPSDMEAVFGIRTLLEGRAAAAAEAF
jgi:DNA-binding GntR family transcriptional regulator